MFDRHHIKWLEASAVLCPAFHGINTWPDACTACFSVSQYHHTICHTLLYHRFKKELKKKKVPLEDYTLSGVGQH
jgi:hypothetical protein